MLKIIATLIGTLYLAIVSNDMTGALIFATLVSIDMSLENIGSKLDKNKT